MHLPRHRKSALVALFCIIGACAKGSELQTDNGEGGDGSWTESGSSSTGGNEGGMGGLGSGGAAGQGGMAGTGGAASSSSSASSSTSASGSSSSSAASSSSSAASSSSSSASSSASSSSSSAASSSSSSSGGGTCPGTIIDWNWNTGTAPTNLTYGGTTWAIGTATAGPADGMTYLATSPSAGSYPPVQDAYAMLPAIDLSAYTNCQLRLTVEVWRDAEKYGLPNYDGGNLQYTLDASGASGWGIVGGANMAYDGTLADCFGASCIVYNQQTWTTSASPKWKTAIYEAMTPPGPMVRLRFTFHSDISNEVGPLPGIYVRRLQVEVF